MKIHLPKILILMCMFLVSFSDQAKAHSIKCGEKVEKQALDFLWKELEYLGTRSEAHFSYGVVEKEYRLIRIFKHVKSGDSIIWTEDINGIVKEVHLGRFQTVENIDFNKLKWLDSSVIEFDFDSVVMK